MGLQREYGQEWRDQVKPTKYPFTDTSGMTTVENLLFDYTSVYDASFYIINWTSRLFITAVEIAADPNKTARIYVGDVSNQKAAYADIDPFNIPEVVTFVDELGRQAGIMVVDPVAFAFIQTWPLGSHQLRLNAELVTSVITPMPSSYVTAIRTPTGEYLSGDVWLIGEDGVVIRTENGNIRVDIVGDPLFKRLEYDNPDEFVTPRFVKTINGNPPDENGDFKIVVGDYLAGDTILRVYPDLSLPGIRIELTGQTIEGVV